MAKNVLQSMVVGEGKATPKPKNQKEQSERFIKTAQELKCDESTEAFDRTFEKLIAFKGDNP